MNIESQVVSLDLAKRLKELGVEQESLFYWIKIADKKEYELSASYFKQEIIFGKEGLYNSGYQQVHGQATRQYSAFTVAELGEMLPEIIEDDEDDTIHRLYIFGNWKHWITVYRYEDNKTGSWSTTYAENAETMADSLAKMWIYLIENRMVKP